MFLIMTFQYYYIDRKLFIRKKVFDNIKWLFLICTINIESYR